MLVGADRSDSSFRGNLVQMDVSTLVKMLVRLQEPMGLGTKGGLKQQEGKQEVVEVWWRCRTSQTL